MDEVEGVSAETSAADTTAPVPVSGTRAERFQVMVHMSPEILGRVESDVPADEHREADGAESVGRSHDPDLSHLEDGTRLPASTPRRLACDAALVRITRAKGEVLDVGRRTRTIPPAIRRALDVRDRGCRFPGCGLRFADAHHIVHWADGGETKLDNLVLLCRYHHRLVHEEGWRVERWGRHLAFVGPRGKYRVDPRPWDGELDGDPDGPSAGDPDASPRGEAPDGRSADGASDAPPTGGISDVPSADAEGAEVETEAAEPSAAALIAHNRARGIDPDGWSLRARYDWESDVPWSLQARAIEALDEAHFG